MTRSYEETEKIVNDLGYILLDQFMKVKHRCVIIQDKLGYKYTTYLSDIVGGHIPHFVGKNNKFVLENISLWLKLNRPEFKLSKDAKYLGSDKELKFYHSVCDEECFMSWDNMYQQNGCGICYGQQIGKYNSLEYIFPDIVKQLHPDNKFCGNNISSFSGVSAYWICPVCGYGKNKEWKTRIANRSIGQNCPSCSGLVVSDKNRLSIVRPDISAEWNHDKNTDTPHDVSYASSKKRWWLCPVGHDSYFTTINNRTEGKGCGDCSNEKKESHIASELKKWCFDNFENVIFEYKIIRNPETNYWLWYDIYIGKRGTTNGVYIEIHGIQHYKFIYYWHKTKEKFEHGKRIDKLKKKFSKKNGRYIEIDLRKIKTIEMAIEYVIKILNS